MSTERTALDLIGSIYDAAGDPTRWPAFLEQLGGIFKSTASLLCFFDLQNQRANFSISIGIEPSFMRSHDEYYASKNIYMLRGGHLLQPGALCRNDALCPDREALRSEFFNDWIVPQKHRYSINAVVLKDDARASILGLIRGPKDTHFSDQDAALLRLLLPHLQRAVRLHHRISRLMTENHAPTDALNRWPTGVILFDNTGQILLANRAAEAILAQKDGMEFQSGRLHAATTADTNTLQAAIHSARQTSFCQSQPQTPNLNGKPGGALSLSRPSGKRPLNVLITPACTNELLFPVAGAAAVMFVTDPEANHIPDIDLFAHYYSLSPAESRVAALVIQGKSLPEVSSELKISLNTAKTHLRRIFDKTSTRRQGELIRLALQSPAAILMKSHPNG